MRIGYSLLLVRYQLHWILSEDDPQDALKTLENLPTDLFEAYSGTLERIKANKGLDPAFRVFSWLYHAQRRFRMGDGRGIVNSKGKHGIECAGGADLRARRRSLRRQRLLRHRPSLQRQQRRVQGTVRGRFGRQRIATAALPALPGFPATRRCATPAASAIRNIAGCWWPRTALVRRSAGSRV